MATKIDWMARSGETLDAEPDRQAQTRTTRVGGINRRIPTRGSRTWDTQETGHILAVKVFRLGLFSAMEMDSVFRLSREAFEIPNERH